MYSQGLIGAQTSTEEDEAFLERFQARIDAEEKIEPTDDMPREIRLCVDEGAHVIGDRLAEGLMQGW